MSVEPYFDNVPQAVRIHLEPLRDIIRAAAEASGTAPLEENLKWGQPSFAPQTRRHADPAELVTKVAGPGGPLGALPDDIGGRLAAQVWRIVRIFRHPGGSHPAWATFAGRGFAHHGSDGIDLSSATELSYIRTSATCSAGAVVKAVITSATTIAAITSGRLSVLPPAPIGQCSAAALSPSHSV